MTGGPARIFFAAWPQRSVQQALGRVARRLQRECGGRAVPEANIHLTLVFLGDVPRERLPELESVAGALRGQRLVLDVDRLEYWRHNRILWAGPERCPGALPEMVARLTENLAARGYRVDRRSYVPHVTLIRGARRGPDTIRISAVEWKIDALSMVESVARQGGRRYEVLRDWPLNA